MFRYPDIIKNEQMLIYEYFLKKIYYPKLFVSFNDIFPIFVHSERVFSPSHWQEVAGGVLLNNI